MKPCFVCLKFHQIPKCVDFFLLQLKCCGVHNYTDWQRYNENLAADSVPDSCCLVFEEGCGTGVLAQPDIAGHIRTDTVRTTQS